MMTHFRRTRVDGSLMAEVAAASGAPAAVVAAAEETATARHFYDACEEAGTWEPLAELCRRAAAQCATYAGLPVTVTMVDFAGSREVAHG
jgi:3-keto-L-gulonate-6-phosphate decarboxylase